MIASVNGINLYYEIRGHGRPLILLHGNGEDHSIFNEAADVLSKSFTCYLVDSRGHGKSTPVKEYHYADMADDMIAFMEDLDLNDTVFYGFSDGGIIGILASMKTDRITDLITSGANLTPEGVDDKLRFLIRAMYFFIRDGKLKLMLEEPHITKEDLSKIKTRTLVLAGSKDVVKKSETVQIAEGIPNAAMQILDGEGHGSYIVHSRKIADLISGWLT
ncbi:MAG: alpha/beta hydrolase [Solobacterium sp.]|nr:alpha/beta hydrolase [Solobacterium sp.]